MNIAIVTDVALLAISAMIALSLAIAWIDFGRPVHALTWSAGFTVLAVLWAVALGFKLGAVRLGDGGAALVVAASAMAVALNTVGFRQRALKPPRAVPLVASALLPTLATASLARWVSAPVAIAPLHLYDAVMLSFAAATLVGRRRSERRAQRAAFAGLLTASAISGTLFLVKLLALLLPAWAALGALGSSLVVLLPAAITGIGLFTIFLLTADLADKTRRLAATDMLTGLLNRRGFEGAAQALLGFYARKGRSATLVLIDIDRFKDVNDSFGHFVGDEVLVGFARVLAARVGRRDLLCRLGGEEFALLMADTDASAATYAAEKMRAAIRAAVLGLPDRRVLTASMGVAEMTAGSVALPMLLARADAALYAAKAAGRDRVIVAPPSS